jgi:hypothetical protein
MNLRVHVDSSVLLRRIRETKFHNKATSTSYKEKQAKQHFQVKNTSTRINVYIYFSFTHREGKYGGFQPKTKTPCSKILDLQPRAGQQLVLGTLDTIPYIK